MSLSVPIGRAATTPWATPSAVPCARRWSQIATAAGAARRTAGPPPSTSRRPSQRAAACRPSGVSRRPTASPPAPRPRRACRAPPRTRPPPGCRPGPPGRPGRSTRPAPRSAPPARRHDHHGLEPGRPAGPRQAPAPGLVDHRRPEVPPPPLGRVLGAGGQRRAGTRPPRCGRRAGDMVEDHRPRSRSGSHRRLRRAGGPGRRCRRPPSRSRCGAWPPGRRAWPGRPRGPRSQSVVSRFTTAGRLGPRQLERGRAGSHPAGVAHAASRASTASQAAASTPAISQSVGPRSRHRSTSPSPAAARTPRSAPMVMSFRLCLAPGPPAPVGRLARAESYPRSGAAVAPPLRAPGSGWWAAEGPRYRVPPCHSGEWRNWQTLASGASGRKVVGVQVPPSPTTHRARPSNRWFIQDLPRPRRPPQSRRGQGDWHGGGSTRARLHTRRASRRR